MKKVKRREGFSLIELMIAVAVLALFVVISAPYVGDTIANARIKSLAESIAGGMKKAQVHAIKRNITTQFSLNDDRSGWMVQEVFVNASGSLQTVDVEKFNWIDQKWTSGGISYVVSPTGASAVTFNGLGKLVPNNVGVLIEQVDTVGGDSSKGIYNVRIEADKARGVRVCMPHLSSGDPKACV